MIFNLPIDNGRLLYAVALCCVMCLCLTACNQQETAPDVSPLPDLPSIALDQLPSDVQQQFRAARQALQQHPMDGYQNREYARLLHAYSLFAPASVVYQRCEVLSPNDLDCRYLHALVYRELGDDHLAITTLRTLLSRKPDYPRAALVLADSYLRTGQAKEATGLYRDALKQNPNTPEARYGLAQALMAQGDYEEAGRHLHTLHAGQERYGVVHAALATVYRQQNNASEVAYHTAAANQQREHKIPFKDAKLWVVQDLRVGDQRFMEKADELFQSGKLNEAAELYHKAILANPKNDSAHANLVGIYGELGQITTAQYHFAQAIALNAGNVTPYMNLATVSMKRGQFAEARTLLASVLQRQPDHADARTRHAYCGELMGETADVGEYRAALTSDPTQPLANYLLGRVLHKQGQCEEALPFLVTSIRIESGSTPVFMAELADCYVDLKKFDEARQVLSDGEALAHKYRNTSAAKALEVVRNALPAD